MGWDYNTFLVVGFGLDTDKMIKYIEKNENTNTEDYYDYLINGDINVFKLPSSLTKDIYLVRSHEVPDYDDGNYFLSLIDDQVKTLSTKRFQDLVSNEDLVSRLNYIYHITNEEGPTLKIDEIDITMPFIVSVPDNT